MLLLLYWALIPMYCPDLTVCRMNSNASANAYHWFVGVLVALMVGANVLTALQCPSENKGLNVVYAIFSTVACWSLFVFVVYTREYLRMSFANVFGYLWVAKKAGEILNGLRPSNQVNVEELVASLEQEQHTPGDSSLANGNVYEKPSQVSLKNMLLNWLQKVRIDNPFELLSYLRSGDSFVPSLQYVQKYTNKPFSDPEAAAAITEGSVEKITANASLVELLNVLYTRDVVGEVLLLVLAGVMCAYLSEYLVKKINCSYKTMEEIDQGLAEYNAQYNQTQAMENKKMVVTL